MKHIASGTLKLTLLALFGFALANTAHAAESCFGGGYIKQVFANDPEFISKGIIGIRVLHDDGQTRHYNTHGTYPLNDPVARSLLQQATTALVAQTRVEVGVLDKCTNTQPLGKRVWIRYWSGLTLG